MDIGIATAYFIMLFIGIAIGIIIDAIITNGRICDRKACRYRILK